MEASRIGPRRALVTGGVGFIGSHPYDEVYRDPEQIVAT